MATINLTIKEKKYLGESWKAIRDRLNVKCDSLVTYEIDRVRIQNETEKNE